MTTPPIQRDDWLGPWPLNLIGRQWKKATRQTGWHRGVAVLRIGFEVVLVVAVIALLII